MDWKQILSLSNENLTDERKEEIYLELIKDQKFDSKIAKKLFPLCLTVLKYKGKIVDKQREEIEMLASSDIDLKATLEQVERQKKTISKYEVERSQFKARIKELQEEMALTHSRELKGSDDEDSPDQLSEIDRMQELMGKLSAKNKQIKRLLRDIDKLEEKSALHINVIKDLKATLEEKEENLSILCTKYEETAGTVTLLEEKLSRLNRQLHEQIAENKQLLDARQQQEKEFENFSHQLEERVRFYKSIMDERQRECDEMKEKYESLVEQIPGIDVDSEQSEIKRLMGSIKERDEVIKELQEKLERVSSELIDSTEIIDKIGREKEENLQNISRKKSDSCCKELQLMLERANERCRELQEMIEVTEADNILKAKQAFDAIEALKSYENSTDGLGDAVRKIHKQQESIAQKDKQIHELVVELNSQNEIVAENAILKRRLGIPEEEIIETKGFIAKQKRFSKINDRLMLQLRASEEMRLQLKIDKNDLKRKINELEARLSGEVVSSQETSSLVTSESSQSDAKKSKIEFRECENCHATYNLYESIKYCRNCITKNLCDNCTTNMKASSNENVELVRKIAKLDIDYQLLVDENKKLRDGVSEIIDEIRANEDQSNKSLLNPAVFEKLIQIIGYDGKIQTEGEEKVAKIPPVESSTELNKLNIRIKNLLDENEELKNQLESMLLIQQHYEELVRSSELSDDEKQILLVKSLERCHEFESNIKFYERKFEFLLAENDHLHSEVRALKVASLELRNEIKMENFEKSHSNQGFSSDNNEDFQTIQEELQQVRSELNCLCFNVLKNIKSIDEENILNLDTEKFNKIAILEADLSINFITRNELDALKTNLVKMQETISAHETNEKHFKELAKIAQYQLKSQQLMLSQFSDDEIVARHLIVDLQSQSNENYLLAKTVRDLKISKENEDRMRLDNEKLKNDLLSLEEKLRLTQSLVNEKHKELNERESNNKLKIRYLQKSLVDLCNQFSSMTPIYLISDFIKHYAALLEAKKQFDVESLHVRSEQIPEIVLSEAQTMTSDIEAKIEIIRQKSSCDYLKQQLEMSETTIKELHNEIARIKMNEIKNMQHWNTIRMLFDTQPLIEREEVKILRADKEIQVEPSRTDCGTVTDEINVPEEICSNQIKPTEDLQSTSSEITIVSTVATVEREDNDQKTLQMQLKRALILASSRSALLIETENRLSEAQGRIKVLEKNLENQYKQSRTEQKLHQEDPSPRRDDHILSMSISTLQNLILEKDTTLSRYQELLKSERQHNMRTFDNMSDEIKQLKRVIDGLECTIAEKEKTLEKLKREIVELKQEKKSSETDNKIPHQQLAPPPPQQHHVTFNEHDIELRSIEIKLKEAQTEIHRMEQQIKDLTNTERQLQAIVRERDGVIKDLNMKLKATNDNLESLSENFTSTAEIDQLRDMLEDKDKHIQDLTETLNQFHDDQQKYINDTALNSAEQVHLISTDLTRAEASNRVLKTQLEALKRQLTNIQQREKTSREMIKTLKNQLIRRPVFSLTSDKRPTPSAREEQQQKRINELENDLRETKDELRRQTNINDNKKAKNAAELGLWEKQKRYQEMAEKLKTKLTEKEIDYERMKANLQIAKNTITRLEKEKMMLENKVKSGRYLQSVNSSSMCSVGANSQGICQHCKHHLEVPSLVSETGSEYNHELINALKSRIESQQRKIIAMELEGKGSSVYSAEIEKMQEELSNVQAKNIRLEAKNIQLQLDCETLKQNDNGQRQEARIKHLEDYILVLKDEIAQAHAKVDSPEKHKHEPSVAQLQAMEQTILKLKRVVEKLQVENKYLKGNSSRQHGSSVTNITTAAYMSQNDRKKEETFEKLKSDYEKLQKNYADTLNKISALQIELELSQAQSINVSCPHCNKKNLDELPTQDIDVLQQQLQQKTALLDRARLLLQRAAGKEKHLVEKINYLKKRVSELEGVPFISEENSESG